MSLCLAAPPPCLCVATQQSLDAAAQRRGAVWRRYRKVEDAPLLGSGTYGRVFLAHACAGTADGCPDGTDWTARAIKAIKMDADVGIACVVEEIDALNRVRPHANVVPLLGVELGVGHVYLVFPLMAGSLHDAHRQRRGCVGASYSRAQHLAWGEDVVAQILSGLCAVHAAGVMHRDLKPANVLVTSEGAVRIADFGAATGAATSVDRDTTTLWYRSPDVVLGDRYDCRVDCWAVGCIAAELWTGNPLFPCEDEVTLMMRIFRLVGTPTPATWYGVCALPHYNPQFPRFPARCVGDVLGMPPGPTRACVEALLAFPSGPAPRPQAHVARGMLLFGNL